MVDDRREVGGVVEETREVRLSSCWFKKEFIQIQNNDTIQSW